MSQTNDADAARGAGSAPSGTVIELDTLDSKKGRQQILKMAEVKLLDDEELNTRKIIYPGMPNRGVLNTFRELRTKLVQRAQKKNFVLMVSSVSDSGGGSFTALNMGASFALDPAKTAVLIDCNLYDPSVESLLTIKPDYGLTDYLEDPGLDIDDIIYSSGVPRLRIVPIGSHVDSASELFSSLRMEEMIQTMKSRYADRYIVLDVPSLDTSADAQILVNVCDLAILVVPYGRVTQDQVLAGVEAIGEEKLAGVIFNN
ncbi:MAG: CpsD/CapB family tyrosine-protein kinase [Pseudomonadales bacterium]